MRKYAGPSDLSGYSATERQEIGRGVKQVKERSGAVLARYGKAQLSITKYQSVLRLHKCSLF